MVAQKFFGVGWVILLVLFPVRAQDALTPFQMCLTLEAMDGNTQKQQICNAYLGIEDCAKKLGASDKQVADAVNEVRRQVPGIKDKCGCATALLNTIIALTCLIAMLFQKTGLLHIA